MSPPSWSFVAVGHSTRDIITLASGETLPPVVGGAVSFGAATAVHYGLSASIVTSTAATGELQSLLPGVNLVNVQSDRTTTFHNDYSSGERSQTLSARATGIVAGNVPDDLRNPDIALICPLVREVEIDSLAWFPDAITGTILQGFLRSWDGDGNVSTSAIDPPTLDQKIEIAVVSARELDVAQAEAWSSVARVVAQTRGSEGVGIYLDGAWTDIPTSPVVEVDPTGAGDVWAAAYLIRCRQTADAIDSAQFATRAAAHSVTAVGLDGIEQIPFE
jgi:1D-myo-inositol 3-kinase